MLAKLQNEYFVLTSQDVVGRSCIVRLQLLLGLRHTMWPAVDSSSSSFDGATVASAPCTLGIYFCAPRRAATNSAKFSKPHHVMWEDYDWLGDVTLNKVKLR